MSYESGKLKMESRGTVQRCAHPSAFSRQRRAVTLIELLITITIIAILSAAFLGASRSAMEHANAARTKTTIAKINGLLMERWASYATRRVPIDTSGLGGGQALAWARLDATRTLMMLEMPSRWSDILGDTIANRPPTVSGSAPSITLQRTGGATTYGPIDLLYPPLTRAYLRRYDSLDNSDLDAIRFNQGAECLYMTIMLATGDGEARTLFSQQDIGDTDNDGAPEFLDGWGRPISFLRWPAGFISDLQTTQLQTATNLIDGNPDTDHDPFDHFRRDLVAFRVTPLIYSSGSDGISDLNSVPGQTNAPFYTNTPGVIVDLNVYPTNGDGHRMIGLQRDSPDAPDGDDNSLDNIHNHLQDGR